MKTQGIANCQGSGYGQEMDFQIGMTGQENE
jgi:hypothetical protein